MSLQLRGTLHVKLSSRAPNQQTPHVQDKVYVIICSRGVLLHDGERDLQQATFCSWLREPSIGSGLYRDLAVWVIFYGPPGGEGLA